jgi:dihydrofolate reductase
MYGRIAKMIAMKGSVFVATSLDGFIARKNGDIDWLESAAEAGGEDYGFQSFMSTVDVLVMGRNSFEKVLTFDAWLYGDKPVVVLTSRPLSIPERLTRTVRIMSGSPQRVVDDLSRHGAEHLYIDGGRTIQGFLACGLVQRLTITRVPVLIGSGIPLFGPISRDTRLRHLETRQYPSGLVQSHYEVIKSRRA